MLITISRQFGAGGSQVARLVADALGWSVVDNELIEAVAARAGLPAEEVAAREEKGPTFIERLARALVASPEHVYLARTPVEEIDEPRLVRITETVVQEIAGHGKVVMVGRATAAVLASAVDAIHVRIVAPREHRITEVAGRLKKDLKSAEKLLDETDENRRRYHREYYNRDWDDAAVYHIVLNSAVLGYEGAAHLIVARAKYELQGIGNRE
ncbi:MAG: AAA family ATPase [Gemmatimonadales bacterium]